MLDTFGMIDCRLLYIWNDCVEKLLYILICYETDILHEMGQKKMNILE